MGMGFVADVAAPKPLYLVGMTSDVADRNGLGNFVCGFFRPE